MIRAFRSVVLALLVVAGAAACAQADISTQDAQKLYERVTPSLVVVKFTWDNELGRRELAGAGVVVSDDGLILSTLPVFDVHIPDSQMKEFKILIPSQDKDPEEIDAVFAGRDERTSLAFLRPKEEKDAKGPSHHWTPLKFEEAPVAVGEPLLSVGLLPEDASYKSYLMMSNVAATLRGEYPQVLVGGGLAGLGSPVFNAEGKAIGLVGAQAGSSSVWLNDPSGAMGSVTSPPKFYTPARDFLQSIENPPVAAKPLQLGWLGIELQLTGLNKDLAEVYGLTNKPALQIGEVLPNTPAAKAGLKVGDIITTVDGKPIERADQANELPGIFDREIKRIKPGSDVTLGIIHKKDEAPRDVKVTVGVRPSLPSSAARFYADDLGFSVRNLTFWDDYGRHQPADSKGVVVGFVRSQSSAQSGGLTGSDEIIQLNGKPVSDVNEFKSSYEQARKKSPHEAVVLVVRRKNRDNTIRIEPPQQ